MNKSEVGDILINLNIRFFDLWLMAHRDDNATLIDALYALAEKDQELSLLNDESDGQANEIEGLHNQLRKANLDVVNYMDEVGNLKSTLDEKNAHVERLKRKLCIFMEESEVEEI